MNFTFTKNMYKPTLINVWHCGIYIGQLETQLRENKDLDWKALRADKSLKVTIEERWKLHYIVVPTIKTFGEDQLNGKFDTKEEAAVAILNFHYHTHEKELSARSSVG